MTGVQKWTRVIILIGPILKSAIRHIHNSKNKLKISNKLWVSSLSKHTLNGWGLGPMHVMY